MSEGHFYCADTIRFSEPTNIGALRLDSVDGPLGRENREHSVMA